MALPESLVTNEVKNAAGTEQEFTHQGTTGRASDFQAKPEAYSLPHRLSIRHTELGAGLKKRRRSSVMIKKTTISTVDNVTPVDTLAYIVMDIPVGALATSVVPTDCLANLLSFCATTGAGTTVLFDGTGNGSVCLLSGSL